MLLSATLGATFLTISGYSSFANASPTLAHSKDAINITARSSLSGSGYIPSDDQCAAGSTWVSRVCWNLDGGDGEWSDLCTNNYAMQGWCAQQTDMCRDILVQGKGDLTPKRTVTCVPRATTRSEVSPGRQIGVITVKNRAAVAQHYVIPVPVRTNLSAASVSAILEGMYRISLYRSSSDSEAPCRA
jgi:hypothetical protein